MKKTFTVLAVFFICSIALYASFTSQKQPDDSKVKGLSSQERIIIAACPTCFQMTKSIDNDKYEIIPTALTAESLTLLEDKKVDMILAGRTLKPGEPQLDGLVVKKGYSFLSDREIVINTDQLKNRDIYTDLDSRIFKDILSLKRVREVDRVYDYLDKGIIVTSWENTNYSKAKIVHIIKPNGERLELSRRPTLYCPKVCGEEAREFVSLINI